MAKKEIDKLKDEKCKECGKMICECGSTMNEEKWMQGAVKKPGQLHKDLGVPEDEDLSMKLLARRKAELERKALGKATLSDADKKLLQRIVFAINAKKLHESELVHEMMGYITEKSPPGMEKEVEETKKALLDKGYSEEKAANIAFGKAWNKYKSK